MTDPARLRRRRTAAYVATTLAASATGAAGVGWAAATPAAQSAPSLRQASAQQPVDGQSVVHRLRAAQTALERVRRDVARLVRQTSALPRPHLTGAGPAVSSGAGAVYVPPAAAVLQPAPAAAPPPANTTTGASGVKP